MKGVILFSRGHWSWTSKATRLRWWSHYSRKRISNGYIEENSDKKYDDTSTLVLLRHGQSIWNKIPTFTGWCDVPLTPQGHAEAQAAGKLLFDRSYEFDIAFTSKLQRARQTCYMALQVLEKPVPVVEAWQLNERHYGALQGRAKNCPQLLREHGEDKLRSWRRDFSSTPPAMQPNHPYYEEPPAPITESLADCQKRVVSYWAERIFPELSKGSRVLLVAHANTIRALVSFLDETKPEDIPKIHIPNSVPCVYQIDRATGHAIGTDNTYEGASKGRWLLNTENQQRLMSKLGGNSVNFARSVFDAWDKNGDGVLSKEEIINGMVTWKRAQDRAMAAFAGKILEELNKDKGTELVSFEQFRSYAVMGSRKHNLPFFLSENP